MTPPARGALPRTRPPRVRIRDVRPSVACGRLPAKRVAGEPVDVWATVFGDGRDVLRAVLRHRRSGTRRWSESALEPLGNDLWRGAFTPDEPGRWEFTVVAWVDRWASWVSELERKVAAGQADLSGELSEGAALAGRASLTVEEALDPATAPPHRTGDEEAALPAPLEVVADRERAVFGSWYELFPRSFGGFAGVAKLLPRFAELGFDVLYFPPVHPIGVTHRKGRNNALEAKPGDPGSPWAIGGREGGHTALHPELGSFRAFDDLVDAAAAHGIEIALDVALQCSPDHPWLAEHPEWFHRRPDGTLKYAENPPKRYQDIYNLNFECDDWQALWAALREVFVFWIGHGVRIFRVDNPHTKPVAFWEWLIRDVQAAHPDAIFLAEAFTRPAMMTTLADAGFTQSYTYFTWKNTKAELVEWVAQMEGWGETYRPNLFANTPDILHEYLQTGGRPAFEARLVLAATLAPTYGIYSGFERCENVPVREGSEEYLDSEKYELKKRRLDGELLPLAQALNAARRAHPALQRPGVRFLETHDEQLVAYARVRGGDVVVVVVNLDPFAAHEGLVEVPDDLGLGPSFAVADVLDGSGYRWSTGGNYVRLEPGVRQAHVLAVEA